MVLLLGMSLLSKGGLNGSCQNEKNEQGRTEHTCAETIHGQIS